MDWIGWPDWLEYAVRGEQMIILLCGGTKSNKSAQQADIVQAKKMAAELE